ADIMAAPPLFCFPDDSLESAIDQMHARGVHRLYVSGTETDRFPIRPASVRVLAVPAPPAA
ncbi:MAG: CBS domain-containing protein, partial [Desulfobacterales bacterium]